jgi:hypothetical protein
MTITKYTKGGPVEHDIQYLHEECILRFGSDDEPRQQFHQAYQDINRLAGQISGKTVRVNKVSWTRSKGETNITIEATAAAENGDDMTIKLPKIGWRRSIRTVGEISEPIDIPHGIEEADIIVLQNFEAVLIDYVKTGSGQLDFGFQEVM